MNKKNIIVSIIVMSFAIGSISGCSKSKVAEGGESFSKVAAVADKAVKTYGDKQIAEVKAAETKKAEKEKLATANAAAVKPVIDLINAIGDVKLESEPAIVAARTGYNALTEEQKALVTNSKKLSDSENVLASLKEQAAAAAAKAAAEEEARKAASQQESASTTQAPSAGVASGYIGSHISALVAAIGSYNSSYPHCTGYGTVYVWSGFEVETDVDGIITGVY